MAKAFSGVVYPKLHRHCVICGEMWTPPHPEDRNIFCPKCLEALRAVVEERRDSEK